MEDHVEEIPLIKFDAFRQSLKHGSKSILNISNVETASNGTSKQNLHFNGQSKQVVFFFLFWNFLTEIENILPVSSELYI